MDTFCESSLNCISEYKSISEVNVNNCNRQEKKKKAPPLLCNFKKSSKEAAEKPPKEKLFSSCSINLGKISLQLINTEVPLGLSVLSIIGNWKGPEPVTITGTEITYSISML